ncbi:MAG: RHS repeat-associated core domain-containing protein [Roseiflexaceae bacterium]|nr:RHS repeat-associated core domain-containing protein [Roseiflexaceae bacterium]
MPPTVWMAGTTSWPTQRLGDIVFRSPPDWSLDSSRADSHELTNNGYRITVTQESRTLSAGSVPPVLSQYAQAGAVLQNSSFKGFAAWHVTNLPDQVDICQIVSVQVNTSLVTFALQSPKTYHGCEDSVTFDLLTSSLQINTGTITPIVDSSIPMGKAAPIFAPAAVPSTAYNRVAAKAYADTWGPVANNIDGEYVVCAGPPSVPCDGAHFIAHALAAGGFPLPASPSNVPSIEPVVIATLPQRSYLLSLGQPTIYQTVPEALLSGDIIYFQDAGGFCNGGVVVSTAGGIPSIRTHSNQFPNPLRYDVVTCFGNPTTYDFIHINATSDQQLGPPPPRAAQVKGSAPTSAKAGDPVNTSTGNYAFDFTDLADPTPGLPLSVTRWYNAIDAATVDGPFGYGTSWVFNTTVTWRPDKTAVIQRADGSLAYFIADINPANPSDMTGTYVGQNEVVGTLVRAVDGTGLLTFPDQTTFAFNAAGQLTRISHPYPAAIDLVYVGGRLSQLIHSAGIIYTIAYTGAHISSITSSAGRSVNYSYSPTGDLTQVTLPDSATYTYSYDANHRLVEARDPNNTPYLRNTFDGLGRVVEQRDQAGQLSTFSYGASVTDPATFTDTLGNPMRQTHDGEYRLTEERDALGRAISYIRDGRGNVTELRDRSGQIWRYAYDDRSNLLSETNPLGHTTLSTYDARNNRTSLRDPLGNTWTYAYDAADHLTRTTDPLGNYREYTYDPQGNLIRERDEMGAETTYTYNGLGLRTSMTNALGQTTRMEYDSLGNVIRYTDAAGRIATSVYDSRSHLTRSIDPIGTIIDFTYDPMGNLLTQTDGMGHTKRYSYDGYDRLISETDWNGNVTRYSYDLVGRRTSTTDPLNFSTAATYNEVGNQITRRDKNNALTTFAYDANGRVLSETDPLGRVTSSVYDLAGQQIETRRPCAVCPGGVAFSTKSYDAAGRVFQEVDARGAVTRYTHDALGRVATKTMPNSGVSTYSYDAAGRLIQETDPLNGVTRYTLDALGRVASQTDPLGRVTRSTYDAVGNQTEATDARGNTTRFIFDANDRQTTMTDALGNITRMSYDAQGRVLTETDALGQVTRHTYDANGNEISTTDRTGAVSRNEYDALNRVVKRIDALGGEFSTTYDSMGRVIGTRDALGGTTSTTYDVTGRRLAERDVLNNTRSYVYDVADNLIEQHEPNGGVLRYTYDAGGLRTAQIDALSYTHTSTYDSSGNLIAEQNERGFITRYEYDLLNRRTAQTDAVNQRQITTYDAAGQVVSTRDFNGNLTTSAYDAAGNRVSSTDALGGVMATTYDALNRATAVTDQLGRISRTEYDALGRVVKTTSAAGNSTSFSYDAEGRQIQITNALNKATSTSYDALGRPMQVTDALGRITKTIYDALGRATAKIDALGRTTSTSYDAAGRLLSVTAPNGVTQSYRYDAMGNALSEQDGGGFVVHYEYDLMNRMTAKKYLFGSYTLFLPIIVNNSAPSSAQTPSQVISDASLRIWRYSYDGVGNQLSIQSPAGQTVAMRYDALNRMVEKSHNGTTFASYSYDANGNRIGMSDGRGASNFTYDALNRLTQSSDPMQRVVINTYDSASQRIGLTYPDSATASYGYNADGVLSQITAPDGGVTTYTLDALNRPTRTTQANGVIVEQRYDDVGNLLQIKQTGPSGVLSDHQYTVDNHNRRTQEVAQLPQGRTISTYTYDELDRLITSKSDDGTETTYTFDPAGNRLTESGVRRSGVTPESYQIRYRYSIANELLSIDDSVQGLTIYRYDADGLRVGVMGATMRATYRYDAEGRLSAAQVEDRAGQSWLLRNDMTQRFVYDGDGRRVRVESYPATGGSLSMLQEQRYDDMRGWDVLQNYTGVSSPSGIRYLYDKPMSRLAYGGASMNYMQHDGLGSMLGATNSSGDPTSSAGFLRYGDYGQLIGSTDALQQADGSTSYTGYDLDSYTGLSYARNRYYDANTGTFLTPDSYQAERQDVLGLHRYLYTQANPINNTDPLGLFNWATNTVESGDTLWSIATAIGISVDQLLQLNPQITRRNLIYPGDRLTLPNSRSASKYIFSAYNLTKAQGVSGSGCGKKKLISNATLVNAKTNINQIYQATEIAQPVEITLSSQCLTFTSEYDNSEGSIELKDSEIKQAESELEGLRRDKEVTVWEAALTAAGGVIAIATLIATGALASCPPTAGGGCILAVIVAIVGSGLGAIVGVITAAVQLVKLDQITKDITSKEMDLDRLRADKSSLESQRNEFYDLKQRYCNDNNT